MLWALAQTLESLSKAARMGSKPEPLPCHHSVTSTSNCANAELCHRVIIRGGNSMTRGCSCCWLRIPR